MRYRHRAAIWKPSAAIGVAGFMAGMMLAGGIGGAFAPLPLASVDVTNSQPPPPGPKVARAALMSVDVPTQQPPPTGPRTVVITDPGGGDNGPKAIVIPDPPGPGPGPKAVVISGSDPTPP